MINAQCLTTVVTSSRWSSGQDMGLGMANSKSGDYNLFGSGWALEFLWLPQCWFHNVEISAMYSHIPFGLNQLLNVGVNQWLQICSEHLSVGLSLGWGSLLLVGPPFHFPQLVSSRNEHMCLCHSITRTGSWYGKSKGSRGLNPQLLANRTLNQSRPLHRDGQVPCVGNSSVPDWWL